MKVSEKQLRKCSGFIDLHIFDRTVIKATFSLLASCKTGMPRVGIRHADVVVVTGCVMRNVRERYAFYFYEELPTI